MCRDNFADRFAEWSWFWLPFIDSAGSLPSLLSSISLAHSVNESAASYRSKPELDSDLVWLLPRRSVLLLVSVFIGYTPLVRDMEPCLGLPGSPPTL